MLGFFFFTLRVLAGKIPVDGKAGGVSGNGLPQNLNMN